MTKMNVNSKTGLSEKQVQEQIEKGFVNKSSTNHTKSYRRIFFDNIFTLFNFVNFVLALVILPTGSYKNLLFLGVAFSNIFIGTVQEIRAKRTLDKIALIVSVRAKALRSSKLEEIHVEDVVLGDILYNEMGDQIVSDSVVVDGYLEVDESLLTGESDVVKKIVGDFLYSGSFVVSGQAYVRVESVGDDNYAAKITRDAKQFKRFPSQLRDSLNKIIKIIGILIIPLGLGMFFQSYVVLGNDYATSILKIGGALIGMIPEGLVILTSIALTVGTITLAKKKTLVQELYCLETLARVDMLCLDKTGTLTEGILGVEDIIQIKDVPLDEILGNFVACVKDNNATFLALLDYFERLNTYHCLHVIPFSSKRKYSAVSFEEGTYILGAYEYICKPKQIEQHMIETYAKQGYRVISLFKSTERLIKDQLPADMELVALLLLVDKIRDDAVETLSYFYEQGVNIKVISGDHPMTVSEVSKRAGVRDADRFIDVSELSEQQLAEALRVNNIFGRVSPKQKQTMIRILKEQHTVAMTGDGVNDVLAFKQADISIAMASGSDAAKASANLVLLDNNFNALPQVLYEGRRVINNIERVATLFLTKTIFSLLTSCFVIVLGLSYPFVPIQLSFISTVTIGIPAFILALEPNHERVKGKFIENVLKVSLPSAISVLCTIIFLTILYRSSFISQALNTQLAFLSLVLNGFIVLCKVAQPLSKLRATLLGCVAIALCLGVLFFPSFFEIEKISSPIVFLYLGIILCILLVVSAIGTKIVTFVYKRGRSKKADSV